jgi:hypothetical protein
MRIRLSFPACLALVFLIATPILRAQQSAEPVGLYSAVGVTTQSQTSTPAPAAGSPPPQTTHRFWDRENDWLFAGVAAGRGLDYASTLNLRRRGIDESFLTNSIVDNHPLFGGIEAAATAASIGVSYLFHRTGHHRLERWTSAIHFGVAVGGAARNYALKTPH